MSGRPILSIHLEPAEKEALLKTARSSSASRRDVERAQIILLRHEGLSQAQTAERLGCSSRRVSTWSARFRRQGMAGLVDAPGRGRPRALFKKS